MQLTKLQHEKLLTAIKTAEQETVRQRQLASAAHEKLGVAEADLKKARAGSEFYASQSDDLRRRLARLENMVAVRETAIVQTALRLAAYGDPGLNLAVTP